MVLLRMLTAEELQKVVDRAEGFATVIASREGCKSSQPHNLGKWLKVGTELAISNQNNV